MKALIATPHHLLLFDLAERKLYRVEQGRPEYYGISWTGDGEQLVLSHSGINNAKLVNLHDYAHSERGWISCGSKDSWTFLSQPHQISCVGNDYVLASNTGRNALSRLSLKDMSLVQFWPEEARWDKLTRTEPIGNHFNSVYVHEGKVYLLAHNNGRDSFVLIFDWPSLTLLERIEIRGHTMLHNLWVASDGRLLSCDSHQGGIIDCRSGETLWTVEDACFTRGVACDGQTMVVGSSQISAVGNRTTTETGLWLIDAQTYKTREYIYLGHYGNVHEVRLIDATDICHKLGPLRAALDPTPLPLPALWESQLHLPVLIAGATVKKWKLREGSIRTNKQGSYQGEANGFGLALLEGLQTDVTLRAKVTLSHRDAPADYVSFVFRHKGSGEGDPAIAVLVQYNNGWYVSLWEQEEGWQLRTQVPVDGGTNHDALMLETSLEGATISVRIEGKVVCAAPVGIAAPGYSGLRLYGDSLQTSELEIITG